jgi:murein tripeptide amidase MpaA
MTFLNVTEIESAILALGSAYPSAAQVITLPYPTADQINPAAGRIHQSHALRIATGSCQETGILLISGTHAREWGGPDILINLGADLLEAWSLGTGLVYGGTSFSAADVQQILERVELILFPDINPDGRHYSQTVQPTWRKNRNPASSGGDPAKIGVDNNRNYDFVWDFPTYFAPTAGYTGTLASNNPAIENFHGTAPFSEAENQNVRWLFDRYPSIRRFIDVHSYGGNILHPWGDDANQERDPTQNFRNPAWNGKRGLNDDTYLEYIVPSDRSAFQAAGIAMKTAIAGVRGESYNVEQSFFMPRWQGIYPTSGGSHDWAFSRHYADPSKPRVLGYILEFNNDWGQFFPTWTEMEKLILDVDAGLVRFCLDAAPPRTGLWVLIDWCWWKDHFFAEWKRVFPPDLWGPYGPWTRIRVGILTVFTAVINALTKAIRSVVGRR